MKKLYEVYTDAKSTDKHHVLAFGRMSPPTVGHGKLVDKVHELAKHYKADHSVVLSHTHDSDKNPLDSETKLKHAKRFFLKTNLSTSSKKSPTFLQQAADLHKKGVTHLHVVAGSDRVSEFERVLHDYNGKEKKSLYNFKKIYVHSAGARDPNAKGVEGMSASKMRGHAKEGNFKEFKKGVPSHISDHHAKEMFHDVRKGMHIKENLEYFAESLETHNLAIPNHSDLAIARNLMPQIKSTDTADFIKFLNKMGVKSNKAKVAMNTLKPSQMEFSGQKVTSLMHRVKAGEDVFAGKSIMVSNDGYILDGHHRWLTNYNMNKNSHDEVIQLDSPIMDLINNARRYPKTFYKSINENGSDLSEGLHDPAIFKSVFLAGGPGSGKDFILHRIISGFGLVEVSSDPYLEHLMKKTHLDFKMPHHQSAERDIVRGRAKNLEQEKKRLVMAGRLGIIVNGTADEIEKIKRKKQELDSLGYDSVMIFVDVDDTISKERNIERGNLGGRSVPEHIRSSKWKSANDAKNQLANLFGPGKFMTIDNSSDIRKISSEARRKVDETHLILYKKISKFIHSPVTNPSARSWIHDQSVKFADRFRQSDPPAKLDEEFVLEWSHDANHHTVDTRKSHGGQIRHITKTSDTATNDHQYDNADLPIKRKTLSIIRKEGADAMPYDYDTSLAATAPIGTPAAKGYLSPPRLSEIDKTKKKPFTKIIKEMREYIAVELNSLENSDDLM